MCMRAFRHTSYLFTQRRSHLIRCHKSCDADYGVAPLDLHRRALELAWQVDLAFALQLPTDTVAGGRTPQAYSRTHDIPLRLSFTLLSLLCHYARESYCKFYA